MGVTLIRSQLGDASKDKWKSQITSAGIKFHLGMFSSEYEAGSMFARAYFKLFTMQEADYKPPPQEAVPTAETSAPVTATESNDSSSTTASSSVTPAEASETNNMEVDPAPTANGAAAAADDAAATADAAAATPTTAIETGQASSTSNADTKAEGDDEDGSSSGEESIWTRKKELLALGSSAWLQCWIKCRPQRS